MLSSLRRTGASTLAMLAALTLGMSASPAIALQPRIVNTPVRIAKAGKRSLFGNLLHRSSRLYGIKGAGVSMASQKRTATKKRGVTRNRRNHR